MPKTVGNIQLHVGPTEVGGPDDLKKTIIDFIDGAQRSLDIAVQELDSKEIAQAIVRARQRRVRVRLVLEGDYLTVRRAMANPWQPSGQHETNREIQNAVLRAAINVRSDFNPHIFHQKFIVRDGSALLTGSTNFTDTGVSANLNHLVVVRDRKVANTYAKEFREIQQGHFGALNEGHDSAPRQVEVSAVPIKIVFAPDHNPEMEIMKQMLKARRRIDFAVFTFARSSGIDDTMMVQQNAELQIRGAVDGAQAAQRWAAARLVRSAGIDVFAVRRQGPLYRLHHKLMVLDEQVIIAGSFNYTGPATRLNDENVVILGDLESTKVSSIQAQKRLAKYALDEIDRIILDFGEPIPAASS